MCSRAAEGIDPSWEVEAKLKALQEKIKADTAKFEQEAKAAPTSFAQLSENPDDGFAKVPPCVLALDPGVGFSSFTTRARNPTASSRTNP